MAQEDELPTKRRRLGRSTVHSPFKSPARISAPVTPTPPSTATKPSSSPPPAATSPSRESSIPTESTPTTPPRPPSTSTLPITPSSTYSQKSTQVSPQFTTPPRSPRHTTPQFSPYFTPPRSSTLNPYSLPIPSPSPPRTPTTAPASTPFPPVAVRAPSPSPPSPPSAPSAPPPLPSLPLSTSAQNETEPFKTKIVFRDFCSFYFHQNNSNLLQPEIRTTPASTATYQDPITMAQTTSATSSVAGTEKFIYNVEQQNAITSDPGRPLMIIASAGSGKTFTLCARIIWLITEKKIKPENILGLTLSNKAIHEMQTRLADMLGADKHALPTLKTFHALCLCLVKSHKQLLGLSENMTIYDQVKQKQIIKKCMTEWESTHGKAALFSQQKPEFETIMGPETGKKNVRKILDKLQRHKSGLDTAPAPGSMYEYVLRRYQEILKDHNAIDFTDMLHLAIKLLRDNNDILQQYKEEYQYILVDEYQDTSSLQFELLNLLMSHRVTIVGDDDQTIYEWRGASIRNWRLFQDKFGRAEITHVNLLQNYRSSANIVSAAQGLIEKNEARMEKRLIATLPVGDKVSKVACGSRKAEAYQISSMIKYLHESGLAFKDVAILYRGDPNRITSDPLAECLELLGIPYKIHCSAKLLDIEVVQQIVAFLVLLVNPHDNMAFETVFAIFPNLGPKCKEAYERAAKSGKKHHLPFLIEANLQLPSFNRRQVQSLVAMRKAFVGWQAKLQDDVITPAELIVAIVDEMKLLESSGGAGEVEDRRKKKEDRNKDTVERLIEEARRGVWDDKRSKTAAQKLQDFLEYITIQQDSSTDEDEVDADGNTKESVSLMTIHQAKGLEWPVVFVVQLVKTIFPKKEPIIPLTLPDMERAQRHMEALAKMEEERRLMFVAMTRAKRALFLMHGKQDRASIFVTEVPNECCTSSSECREAYRYGRESMQEKNTSNTARGTPTKKKTQQRPENQPTIRSFFQ